MPKTRRSSADAPAAAARFGRAVAELVLTAGLAACGTSVVAPPPAAPPAPAATPPPAPARGEVLGENARFVIYVPSAGDSLKTIAKRFLGDEDRDWTIGDFNGVTRAEPGEALVVPLQPIDPIGVRADRVQTVPILCYHRFGAAGGKMSMSPANFSQQLDWLDRNGYRVIRLAQLQGFLAGKQPLPQKSVVITIDDGYESVHRYALPALRAHNFPATLFVYTDFIGAGNALSWAQLQDLSRSGLIDVQAHSKTHRNLIERNPGESDAAYRQALEAEAKVPRELIERRLQTPVKLFAYPFGDANEQVLDVLSRQQYQLGVTVTPGGNAFYAQPLMLRRTMIYGDHDLEAFKARLQTSRGFAAP